MEFPHLNIPYLNKFKNLDLMHKKMNNSKFAFNKSKVFLGKCTSKKTQKALGLPTAAVSNDTLAFRAEEREPGFATSWCFQPIQKICSSNWIISFPKVRGENIECLKPPPSFILTKKNNDFKDMSHWNTWGFQPPRISLLEGSHDGAPLINLIKLRSLKVQRDDWSFKLSWAVNRGPRCKVPTWEIKP